jgi:catalase
MLSDLILGVNPMTDQPQKRLFQNIVTAMQGAPQFIIERQIQHFTKADPAYGEGVAKALFD